MTFHLTPEDIGQLYDIVDELKQDQTTVELPDKQRYVEELARIYESIGEDVTPEILAQAVEQYIDQQFTFQPAPSGMKRRLAFWYVNRKKIGLRVGVPLLAAGAVAAGVAGIVEWQEHRAEKDVEDRIEAAWQERAELEQSQESLSNTPLIVRLPETERLKFTTSLDNSKNMLRVTDAFFSRYCSDGTAADDVTQDNYEVVGRSLAGVIETLSRANARLQESEDILQYERELTLQKTGLDVALETITLANYHQHFKDKADGLYKAGAAAVQAREVARVKEQKIALEELAQTAQSYAESSTALDSVYQEIQQIAKVEEAKDMAQEAFEAGSLYREQFNVSSLRTAVGRLSVISDTLKSEYTIRIITRPGENTGNWRYPTGHDAKSRAYYDAHPHERNHYLIVEAIDSTGHALALPIVNEETGQTEIVAKWGERITFETYQQTVSDKQDNGLLDFSNRGLPNKDGAMMGRKKRGYIRPEMSDVYQPLGGRITQWEVTFR